MSLDMNYSRHWHGKQISVWMPNLIYDHMEKDSEAESGFNEDMH